MVYHLRLVGWESRRRRPDRGAGRRVEGIDRGAGRRGGARVFDFSCIQVSCIGLHLVSTFLCLTICTVEYVPKRASRRPPSEASCM